MSTTSLSSSTNNTNNLSNSQSNVNNNSSTSANASPISTTSSNGSVTSSNASSSAASVVSRLSSSFSPKSLSSSNSNIPTLSSSQTISSPPLNSSSSNKAYNSDHITITYRDDCKVWNIVESELLNHLPLRNITWKTKTGSTKVVERMPIEILHCDDDRIKNAQELYKKPYLYLYLVHCEDADAYKNEIKNKIKTWIQTMTDRQQEWLIVYVSLGQKRLSELTSKLTRTVYDRIKNDFNVKRDRCCQLRCCDEKNTYEELWDDFLVKMKEGIISSAEQYLTCYEDEIRKLDAKRILPGWSFLNFFFVKESLAFIYERAQLYEDALMQYYELEVLFADNSNNVFESISPSDQDEIKVLTLDFTKKNYRELIRTGKISLFDFKHYLFARQSKLLFLLQKPIEVVSKALVFITSVSIIIKRFSPKCFNPLFRESWIYCASMEIIKACQDSFEKILLGNKETSNILSGQTKAKTTSIGRFFGNALGTIGKVNNQIATTLNMPSASSSSSSSASSISGTQSLTSLQSAQITNYIQQQNQQSSSGTGSKTNSLNLSELEARMEKQDRETLDFLLGDMLFNASQKLEELAVKLKMLAPNIDNLSDETLEQLQVPDQTMMTFNQYIDKILALVPMDEKLEISQDDTQQQDSSQLLGLFPNYPELRVIFKSKKEFQRCLLEVLGQSVKLYAQSNRTRSIARLTYSMANYHFRLGQFQVAETLLKSIDNRESLWPEIEYATKTKLAYCQKQLNHIQDYVSSCVSLLTPGILRNQEENLFYLAEISQMSLLDLNIVQPMSPLFKSKVYCKETLFRYLDTIRVQVRIHSYLSSPISISSGYVSFIKLTPNAPSTVAASEKLNFQMTDFELHPGVNHLVFTTIASSKSTFIKDSICLKINNIAFGHSLRGDLSDKSEIKIIDSESLITLESFTNNPLLLYTVQYIGIKLFTHSDQIETGILSFYSMTGVTIIPSNSFMVIRTLADGSSQVEEIALTNEKLPLSQIGANEQLEFYLPVMAINHDTCTHQIRVELQHQKQTKEKFSSSLVSSTLFINPFSVQEQFIPVNNQQNHLFLKLMIQCTSSTMLQIQDFQLEGCDPQYQEQGSTNPFYMVNDYNRQAITNLKMYPGQVISMIFEMKKYDMGSDSATANKDCKIHLKYINRLPETELPMIKECKPLWRDNVSFQWPIKFYCPVNYYQVDLKIPEIGYLGEFTPFEFTITNLDKNNLSQSMQYQLEFDYSTWMISGKSKHTFNFEPGQQEFQFKCNLIPIIIGSLTLPKVTLIGVKSQNIHYSKNFNQSIYVYPTPQIFTCQIISTQSSVESAK
ncbi:trappc10-1 [Tieghemostelium lacteum]|uniref:Trappc10-1 n=1 Tax=Tieghemostelium lacteum TaxID=361077 RepID=A0A152A787_TIELA|nr:trappc10-1 [Tieghemostelium lacteum]|eukprot:KYR02113.1 trappc10-1 [Tieghemostelium lacteum]